MKRKFSRPYPLRHALCALRSVDAQQPTKDPADRLSGWRHVYRSVGRIEAFRQGLRELGYVEGKNIVIEYRYADGKPIVCLRIAAELVRLKVDVIVTVGSRATRAAKEATADDSHCHDAGWRSGWQRVCRQPCTTGRQHYWAVNRSPGAKRKTIGASERDCSQALARGRLSGLRLVRATAQALKETELAHEALRVKLQYLDVLGPEGY